MPTKFRLGNFTRTVNGHSSPVELFQYREFLDYENSPYRQISDKSGGKRRYTSFNPCLHMKTLSDGSYYSTYDGTTLSGPFGHWVYAASSIIVQSALSRAYMQLDFQRNNSFEIINFIFELDDTIAMFSKKFIKEISYGSLTWGVLPFVSDLKSLYNTIRDIQSGLESSYSKILGKRISRRCPVEFYFGAFGIVFQVKGTVNYSGYLNGQLAIPNSAMDFLSILLDEIGFHPDLKTVWDLIPFSFVADYFIPIGDAIESVHPRGWFHPVLEISGGWSVQVTVSMTGGETIPGNLGTASLYVRRPGILNLPSRPPVDPEFKSPDLRQLFNTAYLGLATRSKR